MEFPRVKKSVLGSCLVTDVSRMSSLTLCQVQEKMNPFKFKIQVNGERTLGVPG